MSTDDGSGPARNATPTGIARPDLLLAGEGAALFESFSAMQTTKQRHFGFLQILDAKRERYGLSPTAGDLEALAALLDDHDAQVRRFTRESKALKKRDAAAHRSLFEYIGRIGELVPEQPATH